MTSNSPSPADDDDDGTVTMLDYVVGHLQRGGIPEVLAATNLLDRLVAGGALHHDGDRVHTLTDPVVPTRFAAGGRGGEYAILQLLEPLGFRTLVDGHSHTVKHVCNRTADGTAVIFTVAESDHTLAELADIDDARRWMNLDGSDHDDDIAWAFQLA